MRIARYLDEGWQDIALLADGMLCAGLNARTEAERQQSLESAERVQAHLARSNPLTQVLDIRRRREDGAGCKAMVLSHPLTDGRWLVAISFTGTTRHLADWLDNLKIEQEDGFHQGFLRLTRQFEAQCGQIAMPCLGAALSRPGLMLAGVLDMLKYERSPVSLVVTGHSQGAALMQIFIAHLLQNGVLPQYVLGCGFASPCVAGARTLKNADYPIYHIVHADDAVPRIGGAMHLGLCRVMPDTPALRGLCYGARSQDPIFNELLCLQHTVRGTRGALCFFIALLRLLCVVPEEDAELLYRALAPAFLPGMLQSRLVGYARRLVGSALRRLESRYAACFGEMDMQQMERYTRWLQSLFARYGMRETLSRLPDALHMPHMLYRIDTLCAYDVISGAAPRRLLPALWSGDESPVWDQRPPRPPAPVHRPAYDRFHPLSGQRRTAQRRKML